MTERSIDIDVGKNVYAVTFSTNGRYLVSGGEDGVRVWQVKNGEQMAAMDTARSAVSCLGVSADGKWLAAGTFQGGVVFVWDTDTNEQIFSHRYGDRPNNGVEFSPDSTRLLMASSSRYLAAVWDFAARQQVLLLTSGGGARAVKYSPQGDRIAIATWKSVQVYDSKDGHLLVDIKAGVTPFSSNGLTWFNDHLLIISEGKIKEFKASTGSIVSEWLVSDSSGSSCIALPKHGRFLAYSSKRTVTLWDTLTHTQLGIIQHPQDIRSIAFSPNDQYLAVGGEGGKITLTSLSHVKASSHEQRRPHEEPSTPGGHDGNSPRIAPELHQLQSLPHICVRNLSHWIESCRTGCSASPAWYPGLVDSTFFQEPDFKIDNNILEMWKQDRLTDAKVLLTKFRNPTHYELAGRALVHARLGKWDEALVDAEKAIEIQPSMFGYIAKSAALVGQGERHKGYRTCDIAFAHLHPSFVTFLLLIKAVIIFMGGEHLDAISRVEDLIAEVSFDPICYVVQAHMYLLLGDSRMENNDYDGAAESFGHARTRLRQCPTRLPLFISLISGWKFNDLGTVIRQRLCEAMYAADRIKDVTECFYQMANELGDKINMHEEHLKWAQDFRQRFSEKLVSLGDTAAGAQRHAEAISHYTIALSLGPPSPQSILMKRSNAFLDTRSWQQALDIANEVIILNPSSPWGYELKHAALHTAGQYDDAISAFETMISKIAQSPDPNVLRWGDNYTTPLGTRATIRRIVQRRLDRSPRVLINTITGRLRNKAEQANAFESSAIFKELVSSTTTRIDYIRIKREVRQYFRYVMLSHKWEENEPLFPQLIHLVVYDLHQSLTHDKLKMFCKVSREAGFTWAWSDTCCIDKSDHFVLQEALVAMFRWYQHAAMVIVFLRGVRSSSQLGALMKSIWNTRAWTLQEYIAARALHFYTEDWTLYLDLKLMNHKESPEVISEMEQATGIPAKQLMALSPGLTNIREKLRLASTRQTSLVEDAAYSLLGIFSVTGLPPIYGEGVGSLGRLLAHVLTGSGDVSILAWTGESGSFNSSLPAHITAFDGPATSHLPLLLSQAEMEKIIMTSPTSLFDLDVALTLYDHLSTLPAPWFAASRMKLACIALQLPPLSRSGRVYRTDTPAFGTIEITTKYDLSQMKSLCLIHPWLDALLEQEDAVFVEDGIAQPTSPVKEDAESSSDRDSSSIPLPRFPLHPAPADSVPMDKETRARRFVARLRQPFGALLVTPASTGRRAMDYIRVATDSLILVQFQESMSLADILNNVRTLDIL